MTSSFAPPSVKRRCCRGHGGVRIDMRAADGAHGVRRTVLLVIRVQDEEDIERPLQRRIRLIFHLGRLEHHVQEVARVRQVVVRIGVGLAHHVAIAERSDGDHLRHDAHDLPLANFRIGDVLCFGIERAERRDGRDQFAHRMGVVAKRVEQPLEVLVDEGVIGDVVRPLRELFFVGKIAAQQKICGLQVTALLRELFDRVSAVLEDSFVAVDECDGAAARRRVHECRVVSHQAEIIGAVFDLTQIGRANCAVGDRKLVRLARPIVGDGDGVTGHRARKPIKCRHFAQRRWLRRRVRRSPLAIGADRGARMRRRRRARAAIRAR